MQDKNIFCRWWCSHLHLKTTHTHAHTNAQRHTCHFGVVRSGHCYGNGSAERLMSHREGHCMTQWTIYHQLTNTHICISIDVRTDFGWIPFLNLRRPWFTICTEETLGPHNTRNTRRHTHKVLFWECQQTLHCSLRHRSVWTHLYVYVCSCKCVCLPRVYLAKRWHLGSSSGLSVGVSRPLQDALISLAQAEPGRLPGAQWTVPNGHGGEPVLAEHGGLLINSTRTQAEG